MDVKKANEVLKRAEWMLPFTKFCGNVELSLLQFSCKKLENSKLTNRVETKGKGIKAGSSAGRRLELVKSASMCAQITVGTVENMTKTVHQNGGMLGIFKRLGYDTLFVVHELNQFRGYDFRMTTIRSRK